MVEGKVESVVETKVETQTQTDFAVEPSAPPMVDLVSSAEEEVVVQTDDSPPPAYNDMSIFENLDVKENVVEENNNDSLKSEYDTAQANTDEVTNTFEYIPEIIEPNIEMNQEIIDEQMRILDQIKNEKNATDQVLQQLAQEKQQRSTPGTGQQFLSWEDHPNNPQNRQLEDNLVANDVSSQNVASPTQYSSRTLPNVVDIGAG